MHYANSQHSIIPRVFFDVVTYSKQSVYFESAAAVEVFQILCDIFATSYYELLYELKLFVIVHSIASLLITSLENSLGVMHGYVKGYTQQC